MYEFDYPCTSDQKARLDAFVQWLQRHKKTNRSEAEYEVTLLLKLASVQQNCHVNKTILNITNPHDKCLPRMRITWTCCKEAKMAFPQELHDLDCCMNHYSEFLASDNQFLSSQFPNKNATGKKIYAKLPSQSKREQKSLASVKKKISRYFDKKPYLGDILITDEEYAVLLSYSRNLISSASAIMTSVDGYDDAPLLVLTLVQIGIRTYDGRYWPHVSQELNLSVGAAEQGFLGRTVEHTLKKHGKLDLGESQYVNTILFHGFVSNYYAPGLFELLYQYFSNDLERDINRNDTQQMKSLMETLHRKAEIGDEDIPLGEHSSRAYKLRKHTLDAIAANERHSSMRLRYLIRLIDKAFWNGRLPQNPVSRLTKQFLIWKDDSAAFRDDLQKRERQLIVNKKKKHFSSPYLFADFERGTFEIVCPSRLIKPSNEIPTVGWCIQIGSDQIFVDTCAYPVITGFKTDECRAELFEKHLFYKISCSLYRDGQVVYTCNIKPSLIRMFDLDGDYAEHPYPIPMCIFSQPDIQLHSPALSSRIELRNMVRWDFLFERGDALICSDHRSWIVGNQYEDQLSPRGRVQNAVYEKDGECYPVYQSAPQIIFKCPQSKLAGTAVVINGERFKLPDLNPMEMEGHDSHGDKAYFLSLRPEYCIEDSFNEIFLDIPGFYQKRSYSFAWIPGFAPEFSDAPYMFQARGTVVFPPAIQVQYAGKKSIMKAKGAYNAYNFEISNHQNGISFLVGKHRIPIKLLVPFFSWSYDGKTWSIHPMGDIWHSDFPSHLYLKIPGGRAELCLDENTVSDDSEEEEHVLTVDTPKDGSAVKLDLTRCQSWFSEGVISHQLYLKYGKDSHQFARVYTQSFVASASLTGDFSTDTLILDSQIIGLGKTQYYCDIRNFEDGTVIANKSEITAPSLLIPSHNIGGKYRVTIYETEEDDSGFDESAYRVIWGPKQLSVIDPDNLTGRSILLTGFAQASNSIWISPIEGDFLISNLLRQHGCTYHGQLTWKLPPRTKMEPIPVEVCAIPSGHKNSFYIRFYDEEYHELTDFLYDEKLKRLVLDEEDGLDRNTRYRRYQMLDDQIHLILGDLL